MSKMSKKQILSITIIWIVVAVVIALTFLFLGDSAGTASHDQIVVNMLTDNFNRIEPNYTNEPVPSTITAGEITEMTGGNPFLTYIPEGYELSGTTLYIPQDDAGNELRDDTVFGVLYTNPESEAYSIIIKVSANSTMKITEEKEVFNLNLSNAAQEWSFLSGRKVKFFKQDNVNRCAVLFLKNGHLWRIDTTNLPQEELVKVVQSLM